jgi:PAS domain S-box-containing protein
MKSAAKSVQRDPSVDSLKREVTRLKASLLLHDRMGRLQLGTARQWQAIFDALSFPMAVVDADGNIVQANRAMNELTGKPCLDVVGNVCWRTFHGTENRIDDCLFKAVKRGRKSVSGEREGCGYRLQVNLDPLFDERGRVAGAVHTITAMTLIAGGRPVRRKR